MTSDEAQYVAVARFAPEPPDDDVLDHLPADGRGQSCAVCEDHAVTWVHPFARSLIRYRQFGKGHTLPTFWCVCADCEELYVNGADDELAHRFFDTTYADHTRPAAIGAEDWFQELGRQPIAVWRRADLGARPLAGG